MSEHFCALTDISLHGRLGLAPADHLSRLGDGCLLGNSVHSREVFLMTTTVSDTLLPYAVQARTEPAFVDLFKRAIRRYLNKRDSLETSSEIKHVSQQIRDDAILHFSLIELATLAASIPSPNELRIFCFFSSFEQWFHPLMEQYFRAKLANQSRWKDVQSDDDTNGT